MYLLESLYFPVAAWPVGTAMLLYTGVGAASVVIPLVLIGLALLILIQYKKRGETYCNILFHTYSMLWHIVYF